jgi:hypothetical protein
MSPRPQDAREGEISQFTPEDDLQLRDGVQSFGRHWKRIADEVEFSSPRTTLDRRLRNDCLEGQERNELPMRLERKDIHVDQPLDGALVVGLPAEAGEDAELARVRAAGRKSSDDEDLPRYAPRHLASWRSVLHVSPRCARLAISGLSRRWCELFAATGAASNPGTGTVPRPEATPRKRRGRPSLDPRRRRRPSVIGPARPE